MKLRLRRVAVAAAVAVGVAVAPGVAVADGPGTHVGSLNPDDVKRPKVSVPQRTADDVSQECRKVPAGSSPAKAGAVKECTEVTTAGKAAKSSLMEGENCQITDPGYYSIARFGSCMQDLEVLYTLVDDKGRPIGTGILQVDATMTLKPASTTWSESMTITLAATTGAVSSLNVAADVSCTSGCSMSDPTPWSGMTSLSRGESETGEVTFTHGVATGGVDTFTSSYHLFVTQTNTIPIQPNTGWDHPFPIRCDAQVGGNAGCVFPDFMPIVEMPLDTYGAAAATYWWAQGTLPDGWGYTTPLRRQADAAAQDANRANTCGAKSSIPFTRLSEVVDDSCDEFPFAATRQGGTDGGSCADLLPLYEDGQWEFYHGDLANPITGDEPCVRGHVPSGENSAAGGKLGASTRTERILDNEAYFLAIT